MQLSILTATYNHRDYVEQLYCSLRDTAGGLEWEWVIGDSGDDDTAAYVQSLADERVEYLRFPNLGYGKTNNALALRARSPHLLFLNNDARLLPGWWQEPLQLLRRPDVGIVGSVILNEDGTIQSAGMQVGVDEPHSHNLLTVPVEESHTQWLVPAVTGACLFCKASLFHALCGFDAAYKGGYYEDTDLCLRAYESGQMVAVAATSKVVHKSRGSLDVSKLFWREIPRNRQLFYRRWALVLRRLQGIGHLPVDGSPRHSALCLDPWFATFGGGEYEFTWAVNVLARYCRTVAVCGPSRDDIDKVRANFGMSMPSSAVFATNRIDDHSIIWDQKYYDVTSDYSSRTCLHLKRIMFGPRRVRLPSGPCFLFNSEYTERSLRKADRGIVVYPPVAGVPASRNRTVRREPALMMVGRFAARRRYLNWKNQEAAIAFFHRWRHDPKFKLLLVGNVTDAECYDRCLGLAQSGRAAESILFRPGLDRGELEESLSNSMFFLSFTGYQATTAAQAEHFGIALVEAMSAGCVCLAYAAGGHKETIEHGVDGFLWKTEEELAYLLTTLASEEKAEARAAVSERARQKAVQFAPTFAELQVRQAIHRWGQQ